MGSASSDALPVATPDRLARKGELAMIRLQSECLAMTSTPPDKADHLRVRAAESRIEFAVSGAFTFLLGGTLLYVFSLFEPITPPMRLWTWSGLTGFVVLIMALVPIVVFLRQPDDGEIDRIWSPVGKGVAILYDLAVGASVWMLLPYASEPLRLLMVVFYAAAVGGQVISTAESLVTVVFGVIAILGSAALFFLLTPGPYSAPLALFLIAFGGLMVGVAVTLKVAVRSAISARLRAETATMDLAIALNTVTEARDAKTQFIAAASHDLRQPLQAASLFLAQLSATEDAEIRLRAHSGVRLALEETDALLERMQDHLRLDAGVIEARIEPVPVARVLARLIQETEALASSRQVQLSTVPSRLTVAIDLAMTGRVLRNFVHNALRHADATRILVLARRRGDRVRIYVLDNGSGVSAEDRPVLFHSYVQGRRSRESGRGGLGLGLASALRMGQLMGGEVGLDGRWKGGAAFYLEVPTAESGPLVGPDKGSPAMIVPEYRSVLVVDDDEQARLALAGLFELHGWEVSAVADLAAARTRMAAGRLDLVITDWRLDRGERGSDVVAALKALELDSPLILITGEGDPASHQAIAATGLPTLYKPISGKQILDLADRLSARDAG